MREIGLFYGSTGGATAAAAAAIKEEVERRPGLRVELLDVAEYMLEEMLEFDELIVGVPTYNIGQLQQDWERVLDELDALDLAGKQAALFGLGDQTGYPDTFADALVFVADRLRARGAALAGAWPTAGYAFTGSWAVEDGRFIGLVLDDLNQPELTQPRIAAWVAQLAAELSWPPASNS